MVKLGIVSDTHGLVRPEVLDALRGVDLVLHAGDVGSPDVLEALAAVAPVRAVRGNVDRGRWADALPETDAIEVDGAWLYLLHDRDRLDLDPVTAGFAAVITGHSHQPSLEVRDGVTWLNPGSIGPHRFRLPVALARGVVTDGQLDARLVVLDDRSEPPRHST